MWEMRREPFLEFKGAKLYFFTDLSRRRLEPHKTLHPLLDALRNAYHIPLGLPLQTHSH